VALLCFAHIAIYGMNDREELYKMLNDQKNTALVKSNILLKRPVSPDLLALLDGPVSLIAQHKTEALRALLKEDPSLVFNKDKGRGASLLMYAAALGYDDIVDLLLEYDSDPQQIDYFQRDVFKILQRILNQHDLILEEKTNYEKIMKWCIIKVQMRYCAPLLSLVKQPINNNSLKDILQKDILPLILGPDASNFKPTTSLTEPPPFAKKYPFLSAQEAPDPANIDIKKPYKSYNAPFLNKKYLSTTAAASIITTCYLLYWYFNTQEANKTFDDNFAQNTTVSLQVY
jgi:hypothetical protein